VSAQQGGTLIGLIGRAGTGRKSIARYLANQHDFHNVSIAEPLYEALALLVPDERCLDGDAKDQLVDFAGSRACSGRTLLQELGDWTRDRLGTTIFLHHVENAMGIVRRRRGAACDFVITDVRLSSEIEWIWERGGFVWRVDGKQLRVVNPRPHMTEQTDVEMLLARASWRKRHPEQPREGPDWIIDNNGTLEQLYEQVDSALAAIGAREFGSE
jgi:hypothetical protein